MTFWYLEWGHTYLNIYILVLLFDMCLLYSLLCVPKGGRNNFWEGVHVPEDLAGPMKYAYYNNIENFNTLSRRCVCIYIYIGVVYVWSFWMELLFHLLGCNNLNIKNQLGGWLGPWKVRVGIVNNAFYLKEIVERKCKKSFEHNHMQRGSIHYLVTCIAKHLINLLPYFNTCVFELGHNNVQIFIF